MTTLPATSHARRGIPASVALTMAAVMIVGTFAAVTVSPLLFLSTIIVALMISRAARVAPRSNAASLEFSELPSSLRATIDQTIEQLPDGDARRLLFNALVRARPLLAPHAAALDEKQESATRENVRSPVEACCSTALDLARVAAGVQHGSPASDRVAELVDEINADAKARRAAANEMGVLLRESDGYGRTCVCVSR
jgi:hypothetical protein